MKYAYKIPNESPESDGTLRWDSTTTVIVRAEAGGVNGLGYTYSDASTAIIIEKTLAPLIRGQDAMQVTRVWKSMQDRIRNLGRSGVVSSAIAAVDTALWDLKARLLDVPIVTLWGAVRDGIPV